MRRRRTAVTEQPPTAAGASRPHRAGRPRARDAALVPRLRDERHRRARAARRPRRPQAGAPPRAVRDVRRRLPARPRLLQVRPRRRRRHGQRTTRTATPRSTTPWCGWPSRGRCATRWSTARATSARRATTPPRPCGTPSAGWRRWPWRWSATSTRRPSTSSDNYDGRTQEPTILPSRFPNLLVNGSAGIAVGMATNIPPHNLREVAEGVQWCLANPEADDEELLDALIAAGQGPGLPDRRADRGPRGHRGRLPHRPRLDHDARGRRGRGDPGPAVPGRHRAAVPGQPGQPGAVRSPSWSKDGRIAGIADIRDETSGRTGQRLVIVLKRDAVAKVVLNNLYKHTQLQDDLRRQHAGAGRRRAAHAAPRRVRPALGRRTRSRSSSAGPATGCARPRSGRTSCAAAQGAGRARRGHRADPRVGDGRGRARRPDGAARDRRDPGERHPRRCSCAGWPPWSGRRSSTSTTSSRRRSPSTTTILASPERQRQIVSEELAEIVDKFGDERRTTDPAVRRRHVHRGPHRRGGRRRHDHPRRLRQAHPDRRLPLAEARRQGRARARSCAGTTSSTTSSSPPPTTGCCSSPTRAGSTAPRRTSCPTPAGTRKGQHVANLLAFQPDEQIAQVAATCGLRGRAVPGARHPGRAGEEDAADGVRLRRAGGVIAINLREGDELVARAAGRRAATTCCWSPARAVGPVHGRRRGAAADGPGDVRRHRHEVPRRRRAAVDERRPRRRRHVRVRRHRGRVRQADAGRRSTASRAAAASASRPPRSSRSAVTWSAR